MQEIHFSDLNSALERLAVATDAAECHGSITAVAVMVGQNAQELWQAAHLPELEKSAREGDALARETVALIRDVFSQVQAQLVNNEFDYMLLLPEDDIDLELRTEAMAHWCQGFLLGLGYCGVSDFRRFNGELGEIIQDISEISQVTSGQLEYSEEEEQSFTELVEYLRVGVMLFNDTLRSQAQESSQSLH